MTLAFSHYPRTFHPTPLINFVMPLPRNSQQEFSAYTEIDLPSESRIDTIRKSGLAKDDWVCLEKVHGSNFGIYLIDEQQIRFSKRSGIMDPNENFFGYHLLIDDFTSHIRTICDLLKSKFRVEKIGRIVLNGELFGAKYSHPLVPKSEKWCTMPNGKKFPISGVQIQREPFPQYSPEIHFFAFDLKFSTSGLEEDFKVLTFDEFTEVCSQVRGLLYAKPLVRGSLDQCLAFDVENFITPLPALLGLGNYPLEGNLSEGVVIRHVNRGQPEVENKQVSTIIKLRCSSFMELKHPGKQQELKETFIDSVRKAAIQRSGEVTTISSAMLPEVEAAANALLLNNVSDGRLSNVISKIGRDPLIKGDVTKKEVSALLAKDALKDFLKECDPAIINTALSFRKLLITSVYWESVKLVEAKFSEFVDEAKAAEAELAKLIVKE
eukprot:Tbor_TRINITY_DN1472_c0_g1::TRINITY_DN1472_c0_g1_i1::g.598::m.598